MVETCDAVVVVAFLKMTSLSC